MRVYNFSASIHLANANGPGLSCVTSINMNERASNSMSPMLHGRCGSWCYRYSKIAANKGLHAEADPGIQGSDSVNEGTNCCCSLLNEELN